MSPMFPVPVDHAKSRCAVVRGVRRRARQLYYGVPAMVPPNSLKPCRVALEEERPGLLEGLRIVQPKMGPLLVRTPAPDLPDAA